MKGVLAVLAIAGLAGCGGTSSAHSPTRPPASTGTLSGAAASTAPRDAGSVVPTEAALPKGAAFRPLLPSAMPDGLSVGPIQAWRYDDKGRITEFTVTYDNASGSPAVQLFEALATYPNRQYGGDTVTIRPGLTGRYDAGLPVLQWTQSGVYCAIQGGGPIPRAVPLVGGVSEEQLISMAASAATSAPVDG